MRADNYRERLAKVAGIDVFLASYQIGESFHCVVRNESTLGNIVRTQGKSRDEAEKLAIDNATRLLDSRP